MGKSIFDGRVQIKYSYGCYGMTRGGGKTWHGGMDIVGVDSDIILMPYYEMHQRPCDAGAYRDRPFRQNVGVGVLCLCPA